MTTRRIAVAGIVGIVVFGAVWELFVRLFDVRRSSSCRRRRSSTSSRDRPRFYLEAALVTARHAAAGIVISLVVAVLLGSVLAASRFLEQAAQPVLVGVLVAPWVAYFTSIVVWLGRGDPPVIFLVAFVTTPAFVFATVAGMRSADPAARELLASVDAGRWEMLWRLRLPSALPSILAAARYNVGLALAAVVLRRGRQPDHVRARCGRAAGGQPERRGPVGHDPGHRRARRGLPRRDLGHRAGRPALARVPAHTCAPSGRTA